MSSDDHSTDVLSALPRTRPHRRSSKRPARGAASAPGADRATRASASGTRSSAGGPGKQSSGAARGNETKRQIKRLPQPPQPEGTPTRAPARPATRPVSPAPVPVVTTAVQAVGELAEMGLLLGTRALRAAIGRLPRP